LIKIANWNLERVLPSQKRVSAICKEMTVVDADIWILTETHELFSPGEGFLSATSSVPDRESKPGECWAAVWSRFPLEPLPTFVADASRCAAARVMTPDFGDIIVYACVLPWGGSTWRGIPSADGAAFAAALELYSNDWERLRTDYPDAKLVVAGDFNQSLANWHYYGSRKQRGLLEKAISDSGMEVVTAGENDPIARDSAPCACIDHICISQFPGLHVGNTSRWPDTEKPDKRLSDHFGVVVEMENLKRDT
jgi:hypothetical protein